MKLEDKVALITGASRGIGKAIALKFSEEGAKIIINYNKSEQEAFKVFETIKNNGQEAYLMQADISKHIDIRNIIKNVMEECGKIDILVNNAGMVLRNSFFESNEESWSSIMDTNLKSAYFCSQIAAKEMLKRKTGSIINISSNSGIIPRKSKGIEYGISKAGMIYLTKSLALILAPYLRVNCIAPGWTETDMNIRFYNDAKARTDTENIIPLGRINKPEDIAKTALFLASDDSSNITGEIIIVDGGYNLKSLK